MAVKCTKNYCVKVKNTKLARPTVWYKQRKMMSPQKAWTAKMVMCHEIKFFCAGIGKEKKVMILDNTPPPRVRCMMDLLIFYSRLRRPNFHTRKYFCLPSNSMTPIMISAMVTIHSQWGFRWVQLKGSITTPNEALIHFGSPENTMSTSHNGRILDHLAGYMLYLSTAPSFWFMVR